MNVTKQAVCCKSGAPDKEELELINRFSRKELTAEEVYTFAVRLCDNEVDRDGERFSPETLEELAGLFVGKTGIFDHSWTAAGQTARIYRAEVAEESGAVTAAGDPCRYVKGYAYLLRTPGNRELIAQLDGGILREVSVGCAVRRSVCSICGQQAGSCGHEKGQYYGGKLCYTSLEGAADAFEWSFVAVPAQPKSGVMKSLRPREVTLRQLADGCPECAGELERLLKHQRTLISALFVLTVLTFIFITVLIVKPLTIYAKCIKDDKLFEIIGAYEFKYLAVTYNDIYELNAANEAMLQRQAETDPLTGLINRRALDRQLAVLKNSKKPVALLLVDVDNFKTVNDVHGHAVGDQVLKKVAGLLSQSFRSTDQPARIGGDEFAVLLMGTTYQQREGLRQKVEELNQRLQDPDDGLPPVSLSVGGAFSHQGYVDALFYQADEALYRVKEAGRRGCDFTEPSDRQ